MNLKKLGKKKLSYLIALIVFVGILAWAFISAGVITHNFRRSQLSGDSNKQAMNTSDIILTESRGGKKYWELYAESGSYSSDNKVAIMSNATGNFYDKNNNVSMSFISSKGTYDAEKKQIILYDKTHIVVKGGISLYCNRLVWAGSNKDIVATGNVRIQKGHQLLSKADKAIIRSDYATFRIVGKTVTKLYDLKEKK